MGYLLMHICASSMQARDIPQTRVIVPTQRFSKCHDRKVAAYDCQVSKMPPHLLLQPDEKQLEEVR